MSALELDDIMSRLVEGDASSGDWDRFVASAQGNAGLWRDLALAQRDHAMISSAVDAASAVAATIPLPSGEQAHSAEPAPVVGTIRRASTWSGWAVAALVSVTLFVQHQTGRMTGVPAQNDIQTAGWSPTPDEALKSYLTQGKKSGQVVEQVPTKLLLQTKPAPSGDGYDIIYVRQIVERARVTDLYGYGGMTESRQPALVKYQPTVSRPR